MLTLRAGRPDDVPAILRFIHELAAYEREPDAVTATEDDLLRDGFGPAPYFRVVIAEWDGTPVGHAFYFFNYSTWQGRPGLYLEDLYVTPAHRHRGIGRALLAYLARLAVQANCGRFVWQVLDWNEGAIRLYESLGARILREWLTVRLDGEALRRLAEHAPGS